MSSVKINGNGAAANAFIEKVEALSKQDLLACYQCGKCSAGCPMAKYMDILPHQIIRFAQLGLKDELLASEAIWMCYPASPAIRAAPRACASPR